MLSVLAMHSAYAFAPNVHKSMRASLLDWYEYDPTDMPARYGGMLHSRAISIAWNSAESINNILSGDVSVSV
jgi:hypothetical protein